MADPARVPPVFRTSRTSADPTPGPWPSDTPVGEVVGLAYSDGTVIDSGSNGGYIEDYAGIPDGGIIGGGTTPPTPPAIRIGNVNIAGNATPEVNIASTYTSSQTGNAGDTVFVLTTDDAGATINGDQITFSAEGNFTVTSTATSATAEDSPQVGTFAVDVQGPPPITIGNVTITGSATPVIGNASMYAIMRDGNATDATAVLTTDDPLAVVNDREITFGTEGDFTVTATVTSATAIDSPQVGTLDVTVQAVQPPAPASAPAVATNNALNFVDQTNGVATAADRTFIQNAFNAAVTRVNNLWDVRGQSLTDVLAAQPGWNGMITEQVELRTNEGGLLAFWAMSPDRYTSGIGRTGLMGINIDQMTTQGGAFNQDDYATIIAHELIHGLGIGFNWDGRFFTGVGTPVDLVDNHLEDAVYPVTNATYRTMTGVAGASGTPLETTGGAGTAGGHWDDTARVIDGVNHPAITNELMIGFAAPGNPNIVTQLTLDAVEEFGYNTIGAPEGQPVIQASVSRKREFGEVPYGNDTRIATL